MKTFKSDDLKKYIDRCINDAKTATFERFSDETKEEYANVVPEYGWSIIGDHMIFVGEAFSSSASINKGFYRRLIYRLQNNMEKNFGLKFHAPSLEFFTYDGYTSEFIVHDDKDFPWDKAIDAIKLPSGKTYVICHPTGNHSLDYSLDDYPGDKLRAAGLDTYVPYTYAMFYWAYIHAFGCTPKEMFLRIDSNDCRDLTPALNSKEYIENVAANDLKNHGCCYFSACAKHCSDCKRECQRDKQIMREAISTKRWKELKIEKLEISAGKWQP